MRYKLAFFFLLNLNILGLNAQTLPSSRGTNWQNAGLIDTIFSGFIIIDLQNYGIIGDGLQANDSILNELINLPSISGKVLLFPSGTFLFNNPITLNDSTILKGQGSNLSTLKFDLGGQGNSVEAKGTNSNDTSALILPFHKGDTLINVFNPGLFAKGDWIRLIQNDDSLITSSWAHRTIGQICQIDSVYANDIFLHSALRMDYMLVNQPYIQKLNMKSKIGIECLKLERIDNTAPDQTNQIYFERVVNSYIRNVESSKCTFSHFNGRTVSNVEVENSYFHHAFDYGTGGRAYGVMLDFTSNECLVQNNVFDMLRHSMILQAGANANVLAYNYSKNAFWTSIPNDAAGDIVLHGNYPYLNLFEHNICQNIIIDNSHGPNGPYNTFFRNRAEKYGVFFSASNSPGQNIIGNEISNTSFPYLLVNYNILGSNHFIYGNNDKGNINPSGTNNLPDSSFAYLSKPEFIANSNWVSIGIPNTLLSGTIDAYQRSQNSNPVDLRFCGDSNTVNLQTSYFKTLHQIYPNPVSHFLNIQLSSKQDEICHIEIFNINGQLKKTILIDQNTMSIDISFLPAGLYVFRIKSETSIQSGKFVKQ
jgi:hypothetical protein